MLSGSSFGLVAVQVFASMRMCLAVGMRRLVIEIPDSWLCQISASKSVCLAVRLCCLVIENLDLWVCQLSVSVLLCLVVRMCCSVVEMCAKMNPARPKMAPR